MSLYFNLKIMSANFYPPNYNYLSYREEYSLNDHNKKSKNEIIHKPNNRLFLCAKFYIRLLTILNICFIIASIYIMMHAKIKEDDTSFFNIICIIIALTRFCSLYNINMLYDENSYSSIQFLCYMAGELMMMSLGIYFVRISKLNNFIDISFKTPLDVTKLCIWSQSIYGFTYALFILSSYCYFKYFSEENNNNILRYSDV